jgi:hypothetical protein
MAGFGVVSFLYILNENQSWAAMDQARPKARERATVCASMWLSFFGFRPAVAKGEKQLIS